MQDRSRNRVAERAEIDAGRTSPSLGAMAPGQTRYRVTLLLLAVAFIAVVVAAVLIAPSGSGGMLPDAVQRVSPDDGELVLRQTRLIVHLQPGYAATIEIDGTMLPEDQVVFTPETGLHVFEPGPGKVIESWTPGFHIAVASWNTLTGLPDRGALTWTFRVA